MTVKRVYVEKKRGFNIESQSLFHDLKDNLGIEQLEDIRLLNRYDISGISYDEFERVEPKTMLGKSVKRNLGVSLLSPVEIKSGL